MKPVHLIPFNARRGDVLLYPYACEVIVLSRRRALPVQSPSVELTPTPSIHTASDVNLLQVFLYVGSSELRKDKFSGLMRKRF